MATIAFTAHNVVQPHGTHTANRPKWAQVVQKVLAPLEEWGPVSKPLDKFTSSTSLDCFHHDWWHVHQFPGRLLVFYCIHKVQNLHKRTTIEKIDKYISSLIIWTLIIWTPNLASNPHNPLWVMAVVSQWQSTAWWPRLGVLGSIPGSCQPFHFPLEARLLSPVLSLRPSASQRLICQTLCLSRKMKVRSKQHKRLSYRILKNNLFLYKLELWRSNTQIMSWELLFISS